jgi:hypothetical protein
MAPPKSSNPRTEFVTVRLTVDESFALDEYARAHSLSRSAALRQILNETLGT